ncbi:SacI homology domain-containing protein [Russula earlei]|uniref:SacI homology domain-containing protein n=1 Tax=Russula earlei TaxID=71964 RepID=A0ACC0UGN5_9AGAM|nr:SacI homology domain-containing protein [Russula earlei]
MKRFFSKSPKNPLSTSAVSTPNDIVVDTPALPPPPKPVVPPVPHPRPYDHIAVLPTQDGLLLRPHATHRGEFDHYVRITWGKVPEIEEFQGVPNAGVNWAPAVVVYGIVGILELFTDSYLLVITSTVGRWTHRKVYAVKDVKAIPLGGFQLATSGIPGNSRGSLDEVGNRVKFSEEFEVKVMTPVAVDEVSALDRPPSPASMASVASSISSEHSAAPITKVLANRLLFWNKASKKNDTNTSDVEVPQEAGRPLDDLIHGDMHEPHEYTQLEAKILRQTVKEFAKGEMYFAYDFDITHSLQHKQEQLVKTRKRNALLAELDALDSPANSVANGENIDILAEPLPTLPLWRRVDRKFWWNEHLSKPFIEAGLHSYILPLVQGFFQVASFSIPLDAELVEAGETSQIDVDYIIMSRRSRDRAGLRYQRRGVDDEAHVANFVETETITQVDRENVNHIFSYVQIRGSIPLFWMQSGAGLKPPPQLSPEATHEQNLRALTRHFKRTVPSYGSHTLVNLAEQHGKEGVITNAFREYVKEAQLPDVQYCQYDFHAETKGMKYENISKLITQLEPSFESQGFLWISDQRMLSQQKGVYRVNCIDCLDRTNVVQSAFARHVLNRQLFSVAVLSPSENGRTEMDVVVNDVWANNGDAISRCYAGTSALKGDFTRTGKRDLGGLLNDGINSLARMYTSTFSDWFCQVVIDYMLGFRTLSVFSEFLLKLQSTDPRELIRLSNIRAEAISTCVSRVLEEGESLLSGWTLFSPTGLNTKFGEKFEEKVLLLSRVALYIISFDYNLEKVKVSTRIPLHDIMSITKGSLKLNFQETSRDPLQNAGFIVEWRNLRQRTRVTSYSLHNSAEPPSSPGVPNLTPNNTNKFTGRSSGSSIRPRPLSPLSQASQRRISTSSATATTSSNADKPTAIVPQPAQQSSRASRVPAKDKRRPPPLSRTPSVTAARLSRLLSSVAVYNPAPETTASIGSAGGTSGGGDRKTSLGPGPGRRSPSQSPSPSPGGPGTCFAAFKALPIDPARTRSESSSAGINSGSSNNFIISGGGPSAPATPTAAAFVVEPQQRAPDDLAEAETCREAVDRMVDAIARACVDAHADADSGKGWGKGKGGGDDVGPSVRDGDIVSLAEARKMTSMYAKMEYGVKRLLWLGG